MAIAPFRARRQALIPEQHGEATLPSFAAPAIRSHSSPSVKMPALEGPPAIYRYVHRQGGSRLEGVVALLDGDSLKQLRCPMPAHPADLSFAREYGRSNREQLAPVVALYSASAMPHVGTEESLPEDELQIQPIDSPQVVQELGTAVSVSPLTVVAGQEWVEAFPDQPCMVLLVNLRTSAPEIEALHRTVRWNPGWQAGDMVRVGREHFFFRDITRLMPPPAGTEPHQFTRAANEYLRPSQAGENVGENVYVAVTAQHTFRVHSLPGWADSVLAHRSPEERTISAVQLHEILMPEGLQIPPETSDNGQISYTADPDEAIARVRKGDADVAFLMNAPTIEQIVDVARTGGSIPAQSFRMRLVPPPGAITYAF